MLESGVVSMARVIGTKPEGEWEEVCPHCRYRVAFHPGDIREYRDWDDGESFRYVVCPKCKKRIDKPKSSKYEDDTY